MPNLLLPPLYEHIIIKYNLISYTTDTVSLMWGSDKSNKVWVKPYLLFVYSFRFIKVMSLLWYIKCS
ncbi:hypothetical protein BDB01DRAFT_791549 [Pilobolus umbonatus]|nr:hypothetical protein BDB01DRAFT_791549 [Pilobolus umbonatus]